MEATLASPHADGHTVAVQGTEQALPVLCIAATDVAIPVNYPVFGRDAFRTATGVHAAAIIKARRKGEEWLADRVYSGVPAGMVGRHQRIEVGFMSGMSNIVHWLHQHGIEPESHLVEAIFTAAKAVGSAADSGVLFARSFPPTRIVSSPTGREKLRPVVPALLADEDPT